MIDDKPFLRGISSQAPVCIPPVNLAQSQYKSFCVVHATFKFINFADE